MIAAGAAPDPSRTLAILFGASRWPGFPGLDSVEAAPSYATAATSLRDYLLAEDGLHLPRDNFKDLFDSNEGAAAQDMAIRTFIKERSTGAATIQDVLVIYVGHGSTTQGGKFLFILRSTNRDQRELTSYRSENLGRALRDCAPLLRKWILLDCCCAQAASGDFQPASPAEAVLEADAQTSFPPSGAALYAACSADNFAYNDPRNGGRMFTSALIRVLKQGATELGERLTLSEVHSLVKDDLNRSYGPDGTLPWIGDPDARRGQLSAVPFFPNAKRRQDALAGQVAALQKGLADFDRRVTERLGRMDQELVRRDQEHAALVRKLDETAAAPRQAGGLDRSEGERPVAIDRERALADATIIERSFWDQALSGYYAGAYALVMASMLLLINVFLYLMEQGNLPGPVSMPRTWLLMSGCAALVLAFLSSLACVSPGKASGMMFAEEGSPALGALLAYDRFFRRVFLAEYGRTAFGPIHRRRAYGAMCCAALAVVPAVLSFLPGL